MKYTYLLLILFALLLSTCNQSAEEPNKTNIIYIMADDMGYADAGCYGSIKISTPNIDRLAAEGMLFTDHYAGTSVCAPSRCVLMTGFHTGHSVVRGNKEADPYGQFSIPDETVTVAELLKEAGYITGLFGKWGLGVENTPGDPQNQGFDEFYGYYCQVHAHNSYPEYLYHNGEKEYLQNEVVYLPKDHWTRGLGSYATKKVDYSNDLIKDKAMAFIDQHKDNPFFLYLPVTMPHNNGEGLVGETLEIPDVGIYADSTWSLNDQRYAAMISRLDSYVGELLTKLKDLGIDNNTLVLFTSDNGGFRFSDLKHNGELRGMKRDLYEGGVRVPLLARWPGKVLPGTVTDHISAFWDLLPTVCDVAGVEAPGGIDGISYFPALVGDENVKHDYLYWEFHEQGKKQAVRMGKWKGVRMNVYEEPDSPIELYNLETDISEAKDIAADHPDVVEQIEKIMKIARTDDVNWPLIK
jgi:arylsulfatase A